MQNQMTRANHWVMSNCVAELPPSPGANGVIPLSSIFHKREKELINSEYNEKKVRSVVEPSAKSVCATRQRTKIKTFVECR